MSGPLPGAQTVFQRLAQLARSRPDAIALSHSAQSWSYSELSAEAESLAAALVDLAGGNRGTMGVISENRAEVCLCWLAGSRSGLSPSILNPRLTAVELSGLLAQLQPRVVVVAGDQVSRVIEALALAAIDPALVLLDADSSGPSGSAQYSQLRDESPYRGPHPKGNDIFEIAWTSGTTAQAKGAALTHAGVLAHWSTVAGALGLSPADVAYVATPLYHQSGLRHSTLVTWLQGGRAHLASRFSPQSYWEDLQAVGATYTCFVETILHLLDVAAPTGAEKGNKLRLGIGSSFPELRQFVTQRIGIRPHFCYGSTETGVPIIAPIDLSTDETERYEQYRPGARFAGWPIEGCAVKIDGEGDSPEEGAAGELLVRSSGMLREYWLQPDANAQAFTEGWFRTGDQALRGPQGSIYFLHRLKDIVRRGGENMSCREIEDVLMAHPGVARAAVVSVPDPVWTEEAKAVLVPRPGAAVDARTIWEWCQGRLAEFKIPRYIEFRSELPVSASGKVQKGLLREPADRDRPPFDRTTAIGRRHS